MSSPLTPPYNPANVVVGDAALYVAPANTPMPADSSVLFDPTLWTGKTLTANGATAITLSVTSALGTASTASITTFGSETAAALQTALAALSSVGAGKVTVTGPTGGPFVIVFDASLGGVTLAVTASTGGSGPTVTGGLWLPAGATEQGWTLGGNTNTQDIQIEEQSTPVGTFVTSRTVTISGNLAEDVMQSWQWAWNAVKTLIAQGVGQPAVTQLALSDSLVHYAVALETGNSYGQPRRTYIPDSVATESVTTAFRRAAASRMVPVTFHSVCATNKIITREITAPGL